MHMNLCFRSSVQTKLTGLSRTSSVRTLALLGSAVLVASTPRLVQGQNVYIDHHLVSDLPGEADFTDANLVNPWGIAFSATGPFWISDNHAGVSTIYNSS